MVELWHRTDKQVATRSRLFALRLFFYILKTMPARHLINAGWLGILDVLNCNSGRRGGCCFHCMVLSSSLWWCSWRYRLKMATKPEEHPPRNTTISFTGKIARFAIKECIHQKTLLFFVFCSSPLCCNFNGRAAWRWRMKMQKATNTWATAVELLRQPTPCFIALLFPIPRAHIFCSHPEWWLCTRP